MATIGVITGSGLYELGGRFEPASREVGTPWGAVTVEAARLAGHRVLAVSRHGPGHRRLSSQVNHRANVWALAESGAEAIVGVTAVGVLDGSVPLGVPVVFDDLYFPSNRLPDGSLATFFTEAGDPRRGHLVLEAPFSPALRLRLLEACRAAGLEPVDGGVYVHADGPRFNTVAELGGFRAVGGTAVSQTCGPEAVLAAELEIPYALVGFGVNHAPVSGRRPTPEGEIRANLGRIGPAAAALLDALLRGLEADARLPFDQGFVYRFD